MTLEYYYHYFFDKKHVFAGHRHTAHAEINFVRSGRMELTCDDGIYELGEGELMLIPPSCFHSNRCSDECAELIVIEFACEGIGDMPKRISPNGYEKMLLSLFSHELEERGSVRSGEILSHSDNAIKLLEVLLDYIKGRESNLSALGDEGSRIYREARCYMAENLAQRLTISEIARAVSVCDTRLKTTFSRYTGMGVIEYFNGMRLEDAHKRLRRGASCAEVSAALGFSSQAYFSKCFRDYYGTPPSKIR